MEFQKGQKKRPRWVWVISIFYFLSAGWTLLSFYLISAGLVPLNAAQEAYFATLATVDYGVTILMGLAAFTGAVALFFLRKVALYLFLTSFGVNILLTLWHVMSKGWVEAIGGAGLFGAMMGLGLMLAVCIYTWKLIQRGTLT